MIKSILKILSFLSLFLIMLIPVFGYSDLCLSAVTKVLTPVIVLYYAACLFYISFHQRAAYQGKKKKLDKWWILFFNLIIFLLIGFFISGFGLFLAALYALCFFVCGIGILIKKSKPDYRQLLWGCMFYANMLVFICALAGVACRLTIYNSILQNCTAPTTTYNDTLL